MVSKKGPRYTALPVDSLAPLDDVGEENSAPKFYMTSTQLNLLE